MEVDVDDFFAESRLALAILISEALLKSLETFAADKTW
jgi:hypothetical protein